MELIGIFGSRVPTEPQILLNYLNTITIFDSWHFDLFSPPVLTTTHIFLALLACKFQDFFFLVCTVPLQLCAGRGGAAASAQNCVVLVSSANPFHKRGFSATPCMSRQNETIRHVVQLPLFCRREAGGRGWRPQRFSMPFLSFRSNKWIRMRGSISSKLLLAVEPRALAPRLEGLPLALL